MQMSRIFYHNIKTLIKNVFLLNFAHELLFNEFLKLDIKKINGYMLCFVYQ